MQTVCSRLDGKTGVKGRGGGESLGGILTTLGVARAEMCPDAVLTRLPGACPQNRFSQSRYFRDMSLGECARLGVRLSSRSKSTARGRANVGGGEIMCCVRGRHKGIVMRSESHG